jgi:hypothetical protein
MKLQDFIPRRWEVVDERGTVEESYYRQKNASIFARDMNEWSPTYFRGRKFTVRRASG